MDTPVHDNRVLCVLAPLLGSTAWPLASYLQSNVFGARFGPTATIIPVVVVSVLAGVAADWITRARQVARDLRSFDEVSTRAGFTTALVASALLVLRATLQNAANPMAGMPAQIVLFYTLVTLLPATLIAMFAGGVSRALRSVTQVGAGQPGHSFQMIHGLYVVCLLLLLAPFVAFFIPKSTPKIVEPITAKVAPSLPLQSFSYTKPEDFDSADAQQISIVATQQLSNIETDQAIVVAPDGRQLAFQRSEGGTPRLVIMNLDTWTEVSSVALPAFALSLAWSPDSSRLAGIFRSRDGSFLAVVDAERHLIPLPRPEAEDIPDGEVSWPDATEIVFHPRGRPALALNLDSLDLRPLDDAPFFGHLSSGAKSQVRLVAMISNLNATVWDQSFGTVVRSAKSRFTNGHSEIVAYEGLCLGVRDIDDRTRREFSDATLVPGDRLIYGPDATRFIVLRQDCATVYYLGLREPPRNVRRFSTKRRLEDFAESKILKQHLADGTLCAFVFAPLVNPLTHKVVGPSHNQPKAVAKLLSWSDTRAEVLIQDEFVPIAADDVISLLHAWERRAPRPLLEHASPEWWATVGDEGETRKGSSPLLKEVSPLKIGGQATLDPRPRWIGVLTVPDRIEAVPESPSTVSKNENAPPKNDAQVLDRFVRRHHEKSSTGDLDGLLEDYADQVEHYKSGMVSREFIRNEEMKYHAPGFAVTERVRGAMRFGSLSQTRTAVHYELAYVRVHPDRSWIKGAADVSLEIEITPAGPKIVKQNSTPRDSERLKGQGAPPAI